MLGLVAKLEGVAGAPAAAGLEQIGRVAIDKLVAGERVGAEKGEAVAGLEAESSLMIAAPPRNGSI